MESRRRPNSGPDTLLRYKSHWDALVAWLPRSCQRISDLTPGMAEQFIRHLETPKTLEVGRGKKKRTIQRSMQAQTVDRYPTFLRLMWRVLAPEIENPWIGLHSTMEPVRETHRALAVDEVRAIVDLAEGETRTLLILAYTTGMRMKDCCLLDWKCVDLAGGAIRVLPSKTGKRTKRTLVIPILPDLRAELEAIPSARRAGPVMPSIADEYRRNHARVSLRVVRIFRQAKVFSTDSGTASFHSLRTTWQTLNDISGTSRVVSRAVLGHTGPAMSDTYSRMDADVARAQVERAIPRISTKA